MAKLTAARVRTAKPGRHQDGDGLYLRVTEKGSKSWTLRITVDGTRRDMGLGSWPDVSLADARRRTSEYRAVVAEGRDPLAERRRGDTPTFRQAAEAAYEMNRPRWRNERHIGSWWQSLETYAMPTLGAMRVDRIHQSDVLACLSPIWTVKQETARRVRQRIRTALRGPERCWRWRARQHRRRGAGRSRPAGRSRRRRDSSRCGRGGHVLGDRHGGQRRPRRHRPKSRS